MTPTLRHLRDLFDDMSAGAPDNHARVAQLERRMRKNAIRRTALAGATVLAAAMLVPAFLVPEREMTVAVQPAAELPPRFTSGDGSAYHRLAATTLRLRSEGETKTSVTVPVSGKPIEVAALCPEGNPVTTARPGTFVDGERSGTWFHHCMTGEKMVLEPVSVPEDAEQVTITFDASDHVCAGRTSCRATWQPADWPLAVYEYTPPARPVEPGPVETFPPALGTLKLAGQASGVWPRDTSFSLRVTSPGGYFRISQLCTGDLADRLTISYKIGGEGPGGGHICGRRTLDETGATLWSEKIPEGTTITVSGEVSMRDGHPNRQARWSVGVYSSKTVKPATPR